VANKHSSPPRPRTIFFYEPRFALVLPDRTTIRFASLPWFWLTGSQGGRWFAIRTGSNRFGSGPYPPRLVPFTFLPSYLLASSPSYLFTFLPSSLLTFLPSCLPTLLPSCFCVFVLLLCRMLTTLGTFHQLHLVRMKTRTSMDSPPRPSPRKPRATRAL
jgi:hypothetical protein